MPKQLWTDDDLIQNVPLSLCWSDLWSRIGLNPSNTHRTPRNRILELGLSTEHFDSNHHNRGRCADKTKTHKKCSQCDIVKDINKFAFKNKQKGSRNSVCSDCHSQYRKSHYKDNKDLYIERSKQWRLKERKKFYSWLKEQQCLDCHNTDFRVLELDHLYDKEFNVSTKVGMMSFEVLKREIDKCEVVCANCHRIRTAERGNFYDYLNAS